MAASPSTVPAGSSPAGANAGSPPASGEQPVPGAGAGSPPESQGIKDLRNAYDGLKKEHEPWSKLGFKPEQASQFKGVHDSFHARALELAKALNYEESEVVEEFLKDPLGTLSFLENEHRKSAPSRDPSEKLKQDLDKRLSPIEQKLRAAEMKEANARFDAEFDRLFAEGFKDIKFDESTEADFLYDVTTGLIKLDRDALQRISTGKLSDVKKYFDEAKGVLDKYFLARMKREGGRPSGGQGSGKSGNEGGGGKRKFTLDQVIEDPGVLGPQYAEQA